MFKYISKREALLISSLTVLLYASVYFFERGVASELNIPLDLITISVTTISDDFISFYLFLLPMLTISLSLLMWAKDDQAKKALAYLGICAMYIVTLYIMGVSGKEKIGMLIFYSLILLYLLTQWIPLESHGQEVKSNDKIRKLYLKMINLGAFLFFFSFTFIALGRESIYKSQFNTFVSDGKEYAIVKIYDENVFTWTVDKGKIIHQLTYFRMENINGAELKNKTLKSDK